MSVSVLSVNQIKLLTDGGVPLKEVTIIEDLVRMLMPMSRDLDIFDEACRKYKEIKRMQVVKAEKARREALRTAQKQEEMIRHGEIQSMADGKIYSDKASYRREAAAMGYTEVGTEDTVKIGEKIKRELVDKQRNADRDIRKAEIAKLIGNDRVVI